jgi:hypothetical protein
MKYRILSRLILPLLSRAIKTIDLNKVRDNKTGKIRKSPWVRIPDVSIFNINLRPFDAFFASFGIKKRIPPLLRIVGHKNGKMNRYLEHQIIRLQSNRATPQLY